MTAVFYRMIYATYVLGYSQIRKGRCVLALDGCRHPYVICVSGVLYVVKIKMRAASVVWCAVAVGAGVLAVVHPQASLNGMKSGLETCAGIIIPSLFPFMVISSFVAGLPVSDGVAKVVSPFMRYVFRLPGEAFAAVVFGLAGGYPVGCSVAVRLLEQGRITREQAQRLTLFCVNAGPAFTVTAVGAVMLGSIRLGLILFVSSCCASVITGILLGLAADVPEPCGVSASVRLPCSAVLVESVEKSALAMLRISAWVAAFSCLVSLFGELGISEAVLNVLRCVAEVSGGCRAAAQSGNFYIIAATVGWSGLCVICQLLGDVRRVGTPLAVFLAFRAVNGGLCVVVCRALLYFFPVEVSAFAPLVTGGAEMFSASAPAAVALMCLCAVFVIDLDRNRKVC